MKVVVFCFSLCLLVASGFAIPTPRAPNSPFRICVPDVFIEECKKMVAAGGSQGLRIECVSGRDRLDCLDKMHSRYADLIAVDPEDMYVAKNLANDDFRVVKEIRTKIESDAEFRYEAVAVVHKDLNITSVADLKGLKSCHTGIGRNVGYKIPITKLTRMGVLPSITDPDATVRENELNALSNFFSKACLVGQWSSDPNQNTRLKTKYSNLCQLCERPDVCDYPDKYSGYDGALRCLTQNGGQVAWTKVIYVKKHFGLPVGVEGTVTPTNEDPQNYAYLCPDGTKQPVTGPVCKWAARPWQGYMIVSDIASMASEVQEQISKAVSLGESIHAEWLNKILIINNDTTVVNNKELISPAHYLNKANYTDVIERDTIPARRPVRFCVSSEFELAKCHSLRRGAFSRNIRPAYDCILESSVHDCMRVVRDDGADVITLDGGDVHTAISQYNLKPILAEEYGDIGGKYYAVAVVKKGSKYQSLSDLKGAKSCHTAYGRTAGWNMPLSVLINKGLITKGNCPYSRALSKFFSGGSCVPGVRDPEINPNEGIPASLCSICAGNLDDKDPKTTGDRCKADVLESFFGYSGAFRCLASGSGDVAFVKHTTVTENTDGHNKEKWAADLKSEDFELLCPEGGRVSVEQFANCNLGISPPHMVVTSNSKSDNNIDEITMALLDTANLYGKKPELFKLFGSYNGWNDLLFKNSATGLTLVSEKLKAIIQKYSEIMDVVKECDGKTKEKKE